MVKRNLLASYAGQAWMALIGLAFVPLYISYLGMEAYGLIGFFAALQACISLLDNGTTPLLNREMARFTAGANDLQWTRDLLATVEAVGLAVAVLIGAAFLAGAPYFAHDLLHTDQLSPQTAARALAIGAAVCAMRFCEGFYRGALMGLQRQVSLNALQGGLATLRHAGALVVLALVSPTVTAFFVWQAAVSVLSVLVLGAAVHHALPRAASRGRFRMHTLTGAWRFAAGMMGIAAVSVFFNQSDKIVLSALLPLKSFAAYSLAAAGAGMLYAVLGGITQAVYPRLVELCAREEEAKLVDLYHRAAQLVTVLTASATVVLSLYSGGVVFAWSGNLELAGSVAPLLSVFVVGTCVHAMINMPFQLQLAHGWTSLTLMASLVATAILIPTLLWVVPRFGALGAAWTWLLLNAGYAVVFIRLMHRALIPNEMWRWYRSDILLPAAGAVAGGVIAGAFAPAHYTSRPAWLAFLLGAGALSFIFATAMAQGIRPQVLQLAAWSRARIAGSYSRQ